MIYYQFFVLLVLNNFFDHILVIILFKKYVFTNDIHYYLQIFIKYNK